MGLVDGWAEAGGGVARWHRRGPRERIEREFGVGMHERTAGTLRAKLRFRRLSVRPQHHRGATPSWTRAAS